MDDLIKKRFFTMSHKILSIMKRKIFFIRAPQSLPYYAGLILKIKLSSEYIYVFLEILIVNISYKPMSKKIKWYLHLFDGIVSVGSLQIHTYIKDL